jgi:hypothetical protein
MRKSIVAALAITGALLVGPSAQAAPVDPVGALPGYGLDHAGHDHGSKPDKPKPKKPKPKSEKHKGHSDAAHASGGYDSHRSHPR